MEMSTSNLVLGIGLSIFTGFVPMAIFAVLITVFDRYEKEPLWLMVGVFVWGAVVAAGASLILNTLFGITVLVVTSSEFAAGAGAAVISAPLVEETVKGLAVLIVFFYFRHEFDSILDGVIYGSLVGFGFAAAENINYIFNGFSEAGFEGLALLVFVRNGMIPFLHATLTAMTGIGLAIGRLNKGPLRYVAPFAGYFAAIFAHALHNLLATIGGLACILGSVFDWIGFAGMFFFIIYLVWREGRIMHEHLLTEVKEGTLTTEQYHAACSITGQISTRLGSLGRRPSTTNKFYDLCGELAFKKYQLAQLGAEHEPEAMLVIQRMRDQLTTLRAQL